MKLEWFRDARRQAKATMLKKGGLGYGAWSELMNLQKHHKQVSKKELNLFFAFTEFSCAMHVKEGWQYYAGPGFASLLECIATRTEKYIGFPQNIDNFTNGLINSFSQILEDDTDCEDCFLTENKNLTPRLFWQAAGSVHALDSALGSISYSLNTENDPICWCSEDDFIQDASNMLAVHWAQKGIGWQFVPGEPMISQQRKDNIQFWSWYIDEAFVQAVHDTNKLLSE